MTRPAALAVLLLAAPPATAGDPADHWAFRPVTRPAAPRDPAASGNPVDAFVRARLRERGLAPSPEADRLTLIRRVTFDLTGLPPAPAAIDAFLADKAPDAYERLVDSLLASPRYGERWARHWLDVIRFADSHGFEMNQPRPNAWRYRDWVIRSLNADKPYDRFVAEQVAGDALGADEATGFLVAGPWDQVKSPDPVLTAQQRADELHDMVSETGSAFLGLTVGCARCHDHKFDPVSQEDYYALLAIFAGVQHGDRPVNDPAEAKRRAELAGKLRGELAALDRRLDALEPLADPASTAPRRPAVNPVRNVERFAPVTARRVRFTAMATNQYEPCLDELEVYAAGPDGRNVARGAGVAVRSSGDYPPSERHKLEHVNDGQYGNGRSWISNTVGKGWVELEFPEPVTIDRVVWGRDREGKYRDRLAVVYRVEVAAQPGAWKLAATSDDRAAFGTPPALSRPARWLAAIRAGVERRLRDAETPPMAYAGRFTAPEPVHRLHRGDPTQPRELVAPGAPESIGPPLKLAAATPERARRLALARWLTDPRNPLPARVIANRLWQYHFGTGLVDTPSDLGHNGGKPAHPELLDWLASELVQPSWRTPSGSEGVGAKNPLAAARGSPRPWSLKHLHRLIVTSATYKQSGRATDAGLKLDADAATRGLVKLLDERHLDRHPGDAALAARVASYEAAAKMQLRAPEAADLARESAEAHRLYGTDDPNKLTAAFARNCLLARRLLERGVRFVEVFNGSYAMGEGVGNWDGHRKLKEQYETHAAILDRPAAALLTDLKRTGLLADTLVVFVTEFGRMPTFQKGANGRDHNPHGFTAWLAGAGVRRGVSYGASDEFGHKAATDPCTICDLHATILHLCGLDHERLTVYHNGTHRRLTDVHGRVLGPLLA